MNSVSIIGRLTADPKQITPKSGDPFASMRLAVPRFRAGEEEAIFVDVSAFDRQAALALEHLTSGRRVGVDGRLAFYEWEDDEGNRRSRLYVVAGMIDFLDAPGDRDDEAGSARPRRRRSRQQVAA